MLLLLTAAVALQTGPSALDAYQANVAEIKADIEYEFTRGRIDYGRVSRGQAWADEGIAFVADEFQSRIGRWGYDGAVEYFRSSPVIEDVSRYPKSGQFHLHYTVPFEMVCTRDTAAWSYAPLYDVINVAQTDKPPFLQHVKAPLYRWLGLSLPAYVEDAFPGSVPARRITQLSGRPLEVESYRRELSRGAVLAFDVYYDSSVGYLPRFVRRIVLDDQRGVVDEMYLVNARRCAADGFVPTEWYEMHIYTTAQKALLASVIAGEGDHLSEITGNSFIGHFRTTKFTERRDPVALQKLDRVVFVAAPNKLVPFKRGSRTALTLADVELIVGKKSLGERTRQLLNIDRAELAEALPAAGPPKLLYLLAGSAAVLIGLALVRYRRWRKHAVVLLLCFSAFGCGRQATPLVRLKARFSEPLLLCQPDAVELPATIVLRNDGNVPVKIARIDGGCSCRQVDQAGLPVQLAPGREIRAAAQIRNKRRFDTQVLPFTLETDYGMQVVNISLRAIPRHVVDPDAFSNNMLVEGEPWTFELVQRDVFLENEVPPAASLVPSPDSGLELAPVSVREGLVSESPRWRYRDTTIGVTLQDNRLGLRKATIQRQRADGRALLEVPVVWKRVRFLSSAPDRVLLGTRPVRVFLRCPDEAVEVTKVLAVPAGVKAVVSSEREITVMLANHAPGLIDGQIEVATTAAERPALRIPVVRYAPGANRP